MTGLRAMRGRRADRGVTVVQLAIAMPVVLVLIMSVIQYALFEFANQVAEAAATEGLQAATVYDTSGNPCTPSPAGRSRRERCHRWPPPRTSCSCSRARRHRRLTIQTVTVVVTGTAMQLVPGLNLPVSMSAAGPIERLP